MRQVLRVAEFPLVAYVPTSLGGAAPPVKPSSPLPETSPENKQQYEPCHEKTGLRVSDQVPYKPGCAITEDGYRLEILDLASRGIVLSVAKAKALIRSAVRSGTADQCLCFRICKKPVFS